jgi:hypothetical protein
MNIGNQIIASLDDFVQTIGDSQFVPQQKFLFEMIYGMVASGSVLLADVARHLEQGTDLIHIEKRLSLNLQSPRFDEEQVQYQYLHHIADQITSNTTISVDIGDIRKDYARKMENLCEVWDGSRRGKATGYWLLQIEAHHSDGRRTGVYTDAWSQEAEDFTSRNKVVLEAVEKVAEAFGGKGVYVEDRGGDGQEMILGLDELAVRYIIRQRGDRHVRIIGRTCEQSVSEVAQEVKLKSSIDVWHRHRNGRWELKHLRYGWCQVQWPHNGRIYTLVVVIGWGDEPLMLWTNIKVETRKGALFVLKSYMRRWAVEDSGRVLKQEFKLEKVRALKWESIRRTVILAGLAYGFVCQVHAMGKKVVEFVTNLVQAFKEPKKVWAYRIRQGLAALWPRHLPFRPSNFG